MRKNLFSIIDRMVADLPGYASRITHHSLRFAFYILRSARHGTRNTFATTAFVLFFTIALLHADDKITYQDHILPLVEANCSKCHNADKKKADLDLTSYQGALKGSGSGPVLLSGNLDGSKLWKAITHAEEPNMPPNRPKLDDKDLDLFKKWIVGGLLETANGKAVAATAPAVDLTLKADSIGKPEGPPPMPGDLPVVPVVHTAHLNAITGLASSPWAPLIAIAGQKQILLFNAESRDLLGILPFTEGQSVDVKFCRSGQLLLANGGRGARSGRVVLWDVVTGKRQATLGDDYDTILTADIRPDQSQVAVGSPSRLVKIFSTQTGELQHKIKKHTDWVTAVAFSPNGQMLATADRNGGISLWDPDNAQELFTLAGHKSAVTALSWRGDSKLLASSSEDGTVKLWEMQEGKQFKSWNAHGAGALCVNYAHDGRLVSCGRDNNITLWDANGGKIRSITATNDLPLRVTFSHDDSTIFASDFSGHVTAYAAKDGKLLGELDANPLPSTERAAAPKRVAEK
jgi:WD40 repeat protein